MSTDVAAPSAELEHPEPDETAAVELHHPERGMLRIEATQTELSDRQRAALIAKGWPLDQMSAGHIDAMMHLCQVRGLDPWSGDIVPMVTPDGIINIITIAALRRLAQATGEHEGLTGKEWLDDHGEGYEVWPKAMGRPYGARCGVYRHGQREATYATVYTEEVEAKERVPVYGTKDGRRVITGHVWQLAERWQDGKGVLQMVMKCAEAAGLREVFPETCSGLYLAEEVGKIRAQRRAEQAAEQQAEAMARVREHIATTQAAAAESAPERETPDDGVVHEGIVMPPEERTGGERAADLRERVQGRAAQRAEDEAATPQEAPPEEEGAQETPSPAAIPVPITPAERAQCLRGEITEMADILGVPVTDFTKRLRGGLDGADDAALLRFARRAPLRASVAAALRTAGRYEEAIAYEACGDLVAPPDVLFGRAVLAD